MLAEALGVNKHKQVALVGGGGKTTALFHLAKEQAAVGKKVVLATTTRMYVPSPEVPLMLNTDLQTVVKTVQAASRPVLVGQGVENDKVVGVPCSWVEALAGLPGIDLLVYEADGSRNRPLKFPAEYEPVFCGSGLLVLVLGLSCLDKPLGPENFQRTELAERHLALTLGTMLTAERVQEIIAHPRSYGRYWDYPHVTCLINQADTADDRRRASELAGVLLRLTWLRRVVVTALEAENVECDIYER